MRPFRALVLLVASMILATPSFLYGQDTSPNAQAIRAVLDKQVVDWNRGDLEAFATGYKNSPDILFMGSKISRGYAQMLNTYRTGYSNKEKMGTLSFASLEVQPLDGAFYGEFSAGFRYVFHLAIAPPGTVDAHHLRRDPAFERDALTLAPFRYHRHAPSSGACPRFSSQCPAQPRVALANDG